MAEAASEWVYSTLSFSEIDDRRELPLIGVVIPFESLVEVPRLILRPREGTGEGSIT
jgi:hypothetical protein